MLRTLEIRDMLIIDHLALEFRSGLNVLTGETGAGKSILLDSLGFVLGWRGRAELVRAGAARGEVTAVFELSAGHPAHTVLEEAGFGRGSELILRRVNHPDGRKQAYVNDRRASGEMLRALSATLVELHGQHDDRGLLNPGGHREVLDAFAGCDLAPTRKAWKSWAAARHDLNAAQKRADEIRGEEDYLRHAVAELDALDPQKGEEATLDARRRLMQSGARRREDLSKALNVLGADGAEGQMIDALRWIEDVVPDIDGQLDEAVTALGRALNELAQSAQGVEACLDALNFDPQDLEQVEERLFAIRALARKHEVLADDLAGFADGLRARLSQLDGAVDELAALHQAVAQTEQAYERAATALSKQRAQAATRLDAAMSKELAPLKMERAVFTTELSPQMAGPDGHDGVAFTVATNPGAPAGPLNKIASGGELSRFLLALKVCLTRHATGITMIFDEIDRGVGGATADAVGRRLAALAEDAQVLVVTHSPQVAALGGHHWRVEKQVRDGATFSTVLPLDGAERVNEIARMVSGDKISDAARDAARVLLDG